MKQMPTIQKVMTTVPHSISVDDNIQKATTLMREFHIRHLPVFDGSSLVGMLTDRDVKLASAYASAEKLTAKDIMTKDPYVVRPEAALGDVVVEMAEKKFGSAIVQQSNGKVVGIFTAVDGLRVLSETLNAFYKPASM